jgi:hypothetical protein
MTANWKSNGRGGWPVLAEYQDVTEVSHRSILPFMEMTLQTWPSNQALRAAGKLPRAKSTKGSRLR